MGGIGVYFHLKPILPKRLVMSQYILNIVSKFSDKISILESLSSFGKFKSTANDIILKFDYNNFFGK
jgi:hypothetical protein